MVRNIAVLTVIIVIMFLLVGFGSCTTIGGKMSEEEHTIYYFDATSLVTAEYDDSIADIPGNKLLKKWDTAHLLAAIQGIVNRENEQLFIRFMPDPDDFWWEQLRQEGEWLDGRSVVEFKTLEEVISHFKSDFNGIIVYDGSVPATSNIASTIAGVEGRLPVRYDEDTDSIYSLIMGMNYYSDIKRLINEDGSSMFTGKGVIPGTALPSTGSAKNDAYIWAKINYLDKGLCSKEYMAYYIDFYWTKTPGEFSQNCLFNHDFFISKKAFFFDLGPWEYEAPIDDRDQELGTDLETLKALLKSFNKISGNKIFTIGGFVPWPWKYTNFEKSGGIHDPVEAEWRYAKIISSYNGVMDADAPSLNGMANASFYTHFPIKNRYRQNRKPTIKDFKDRHYILRDGEIEKLTFVLIYMGDYDSAAWMNRFVPRLWSDQHHGEVVGNWAFNPNLVHRIPHVFDYVRTHKSSNDWFISGDSGAGYLNPSMLLKESRDGDSGLPEALDEWVEWNKKYFDMFDLDITGFLIDAFFTDSKVLDAYKEFSPAGVIGQRLTRSMGLCNGMPYIKMAADLPDDPTRAGEELARLVGGSGPSFWAARTILKTPEWHLQMMDVAQEKSANELVFVDPYTFFVLLKMHMKNEGAEAK